MRELVGQVVPLGASENGHITRRSATMHQRGHDRHNTTCNGATCHKAGTWAARQLITPRAFLDAARSSQSITRIAAHLMVTVPDVDAYLDGLSAKEFRIMRELVGKELTP